MNWKKLLYKPGTMLSGLAVCSGLLVDFQGAASKVSGAIPIISAFLPLIAIGGATFFGFWSITSLSTLVWSLRPAARFGRYYPTIVSTQQIFVKHMNHSDFDLVLDPKPKAELHAATWEILGTLPRFGIRCPDVGINDKDYLSTWFKFLSEIAPMARHNDLTKAREMLAD